MPLDEERKQSIKDKIRNLSPEQIAYIKEKRMEKCVHESQLVFTGGFASLLAGSAVFHKGLQYFPRALPGYQRQNWRFKLSLTMMGTLGLGYLAAEKYLFRCNAKNHNSKFFGID